MISLLLLQKNRYIWTSDLLLPLHILKILFPCLVLDSHGSDLKHSFPENSSLIFHTIAISTTAHFWNTFIAFAAFITTNTYSNVDSNSSISTGDCFQDTWRNKSCEYSSSTNFIFPYYQGASTHTLIIVGNMTFCKWLLLLFLRKMTTEFWTCPVHLQLQIQMFWSTITIIFGWKKLQMWKSKYILFHF